MIALRHAHSALRGPNYETVSADGFLYVFTRWDDGERLLIAVNAGDTPATATAPENLDLLWGDGSATAGTITVPARSGTVWRVG